MNNRSLDLLLNPHSAMKKYKMRDCGAELEYGVRAGTLRMVLRRENEVYGNRRFRTNRREYRPA